MWDSSFMADMDNFSEINENFDTIKTLLNSIRAQGILNTSDVDKLLSGINAKLEKINDATNVTEESDNDNSNESDVSFFGMILQTIKESALLLIALLGCFLAYNVIKVKKKIASEKQAEDDKCDDQYIE